MIKDFLISFRDNFKEKTRNPFLGTYLVVWTVRNWEVIFAIFNFDDDFSLKDKIEFVNSYYNKTSFIENLLTTILWAFGLLILTYLLLSVSRLITNFSEKQITPWIYKITDSKSIVLKETYDKLRTENNRIEDQLENERETKKRLLSEISELEKTIDDLKLSDEEKENINSKNKTILSLDNEVDVLFNKIKQKKLIDDYINVINRIGEKEAGWISNEYWEKSTSYFVRLGLLSGGKTTDMYSELNITDVGEKVLRRARLEIE